MVPSFDVMVGIGCPWSDRVGRMETNHPSVVREGWESTRGRRSRFAFPPIVILRAVHGPKDLRVALRDGPKITDSYGGDPSVPVGPSG